MRTREPIDQFIGMRIRERRTALGVTQRELAQPLGVAPVVISKYEVGDNSISAARLYEIAKQLGIAPDYFFQGFEDCHATDMPANQRMLLNFMRDLGQIENKAYIEALSNIVRALIGQD